MVNLYIGSEQLRAGGTLLHQQANENDRVPLSWGQHKKNNVCLHVSNKSQGVHGGRHISLHCCIFKPSISQNLSSTCLTAVFMSNSNFWLCRCLCDGIACYFHVTISYYLTVLPSCVSQPSTPHLLLSFKRHKAG